VIYEKLKVDAVKVLRESCERKELEIIEVKFYLNYFHMFIRIPL